MSIHVTDFKWEKGKNDLQYIKLLEKTLENEKAITAKAVAKIRTLSDEKKELRANVIDEFAEAIMVKATELSEKVVFDGRLVGDALSLDCVSDMVLEIASNLKGEKE